MPTKKEVAAFKAIAQVLVDNGLSNREAVKVLNGVIEGVRDTADLNLVSNSLEDWVAEPSEQ